VLALAPDLVVANEEENRAVDLEALRRSGSAVWVTQVRSVDDGLTSLGRLLEVCGVDEPAWLAQARRVWHQPPQVVPGRRVRAVVPIWRRPWMALGHSTFAGDVLRRLGVDNVLAGSPERYPRFSPDDLPEHDLAVLPDEPYAFTADDGPEALPHSDCALVSGRHLTWYGPSLVEAAALLVAQLRDVLPRRS
jgi:ABC-type Fe3+-hydroxamate transport system substrate-binding protein